MRTMERAAFFTSWREKKLHNLILGVSGAFGNAATRIEAFAVTGGSYAYGGYPDIDAFSPSNQSSAIVRSGRNCSIKSNA